MGREGKQMISFADYQPPRLRGDYSVVSFHDDRRGRVGRNPHDSRRFRSGTARRRRNRGNACFIIIELEEAANFGQFIILKCGVNKRKRGSPNT